MINNFIKMLLLALIILFSACENKNTGYEEYFHPMGNNPVEVKAWLKHVRKSLVGQEASITTYLYQDEEFYCVEVLQKEDNTKIGSYRVYTDDGVEYCYSEYIVPPTEETDSEESISVNEEDGAIKSCAEFIETAEEQVLLWHNKQKKK